MLYDIAKRNYKIAYYTASRRKVDQRHNSLKQRQVAVQSTHRKKPTIINPSIDFEVKNLNVPAISHGIQHHVGRIGLYVTLVYSGNQVNVSGDPSGAPIVFINEH